jgi:hypothetical protein
MALAPGDLVSLLHSAEKGKVLATLPNGLVRVHLSEIDMEVDLPPDELVPVAIPKAAKPKAAEDNLPVQTPATQTLPSIRWPSGQIAVAIHAQAALSLHVHNGYSQAIEGYAYMSGKLPFRLSLKPGASCTLWPGLPVEGGVLTLHTLFVSEGPLPHPPVCLSLKWTNKHLIAADGQPFLLKSEEPLPQSSSLASSLASTPLLPKDQATTPPIMPPLREIDLHLEALVPHADATDVLRALDIQLAAFEQALNTAILDGCREIVFIHGVGAGVLKKNLRQRLKQYAAVRQVLDDTSGKYGNGATRVLLHR